MEDMGWMFWREVAWRSYWKKIERSLREAEDKLQDYALNFKMPYISAMNHISIFKVEGENSHWQGAVGRKDV
ncbi:hypothetical protein RIF29_20771 [Crotalaria pallida]|uniref:Uncharacterized protein n=1 Tax=Crotalaria pallida TaxID=3830 RepID=A0AAN9F447_CROPI